MLERILVVIAFFLILFCADGFPQSSTQDPKEAARSSYNLFRQTISGTGSIKQNYVNPLLGNVPLYTIDRSSSGNVQLLCPSMNEFLTIIGQPTSTGDVNFTLFWDSNRDGHMDHQLLIDRVSGVCSNGFIKCYPGTWNNCMYYTFSSDGVNLMVEQASYAQMSGCFCINNYCGNNLFMRNAPYILSIFGGSVVNAFQKVNPSFAVSSALIEDISIKFYGQDVGSCVSPGASGTVRQLSSLKDSPAVLSGLATERFQYDIENPETVAYHVYTAAKQMNETFEYRTCQIKREVTEKRYRIEEMYAHADQCIDGCFGSSIPGPFLNPLPMIYYIMGVRGDFSKNTSSLYFEITPDIYKYLNSVVIVWYHKATEEKGPGGRCPCFYDNMVVRLYINDILIKEIPPQPSSMWGCVMTSEFIPKDLLYHNPNGPALNKISVEVVYGGGWTYTGCRPVKIYLCLSELPPFCYPEEKITDTCSSLAENGECVLWEEKIDGVLTYSGGMRTGLSPVPSCITSCGEARCGNWLIERVYRCKSQQTDLSSAEKRLSSVVSTISYSSGVLQFDDVRMEGNTWISYPQQKLYVSADRPSDECMMICRVKSSSPGREVEFNMELRGSSNPRSEFIYKMCIRDPQTENYVCPVSQGEIIDRDCGCHTFLPEALTAIQALRLASSDFICSTGIEKAY